MSHNPFEKDIFPKMGHFENWVTSKQEKLQNHIKKGHLNKGHFRVINFRISRFLDIFIFFKVSHFFNYLIFEVIDFEVSLVSKGLIFRSDPFPNLNPKNNRFHLEKRLSSKIMSL